MADRCEPGPTAEPVAWWWGTNRAGGTYYAGRVHVVHPNHPSHGLCGLPITDVWELRPPVPDHLCDHCCVLAMAASYPPFATAVPQQATGQHAADDGWFAALSDQPAVAVDPLTEQTTVTPASR
ncbi:MAG TPA: hypothetical protein VGD84_00400 [Pseudonocardiaceae bacterium]